jgi:hypothetical protein
MRKMIAVLAALTFMVALAGCSDDDDSAENASDKEPATTTTTETPALDPKDIDTEASPYCATWAEIRTAGGPASQDAETVKKHYGDLIPTVEKLLKEAPGEIKSSVQVALDSTKSVAASGSLADYQRPEVQEAQRKLSDYAAANCKKK